MNIHERIRGEALRFRFSVCVRMVSLVCCLSMNTGPARADEAAPGPIDFNTHILPILSDRCFPCHGPDDRARKADLRLDHKDHAFAILKDSDGHAFVPSDPDRSIAWQRMQSEDSDERMPPPESNLSLSTKEKQQILQWINEGASWTEHWAFVPAVKSILPFEQENPLQENGHMIRHPIDAFVLSAMKDRDLDPTLRASKEYLIRRLSFDLTGLPPSPEEIDTFLADDSPTAYEQLIDRFLYSQAHAERLAMEWLDVARYADSQGMHGDRERYHWPWRDWVIKAFQQNMPYDAFITWQLAGDLLPNATREQILATAFNRNHPVSAEGGIIDEEFRIKYVQDRINTVGTAFMGLTLECASCHDHKFDAISQKDYYALFGILSNGRPAQRVIETPKRLSKNESELTELKKKIRSKLSLAWKEAVTDIAENLQTPPSKKWQDAILDGSSHNPFKVWAKMRNAHKDNFARDWKVQKESFLTSKDILDRRHSGAYRRSWKLGDSKQYAKWSKSGRGMKKDPSPAGSFHVLTSGEQIIDRILPSGTYTHLLSKKQNGTLSSPRFLFDEGNVWIRAVGDKGTTLRYVVWNYPRRGTVYPKGSPDPMQEKWINWNTKYWSGDEGYLEATTNRDHPVEAGGGTTSWFGVTEAVLTSPGQDPPRDEIAEVLSPLFSTETDPKDTPELAKRYSEVMNEAIEAWEKGQTSDAQARILNFLVVKKLLPTSIKEIPQLEQDATEYRSLEKDVVSPRLAPGILDNEPFDQALFVRGNHKEKSDLVPRRFLESLNHAPYPKSSIGRLEYAKDVLDQGNPFTSRVIVNRLWHHLFGRGIVATPDNLGRLGELPSHPELLDYLALRFRKEEWSIKKMIKFMTTTKAFRLASSPSEKARLTDPDNLLLSHARIRRLEAEAIRDAILSAAQKINLGAIAEGGSVAGNTTRRAVYKQVKRNSLDPFLTVFDAPVPSSTKGRRDSTNVPAQSLTMMNDSFVTNAALDLARNTPGDTEEEKISNMFRLTLGRRATETEKLRAESYLKGADKEEARALAEKKKIEKDWTENSFKLKGILEPVRAEILRSRKSSQTQKTVGPLPSLHWDFGKGWKDSVRGISAHPKGGAKIHEGLLLVRGGSYAVTDPIPLRISEKTLEAWVKLDNLNQRAGGLITLQTRNGMVFDSIVYAEKSANRWMSGSNGFRRTKSFGGTHEKRADKEFVHLAITYRKDGTITGYRNGLRYGTPYKTDLATFPQKESVLSFGVRHLPANPSRMLHAQIKEARFYDRALKQSACILPLAQLRDAKTERNGLRNYFLIGSYYKLFVSG